MINTIIACDPGQDGAFAVFKHAYGPGAEGFWYLDTFAIDLMERLGVFGLCFHFVFVFGYLFFCYVGSVLTLNKYKHSYSHTAKYV
jgi:hypothetical protein